MLQNGSYGNDQDILAYFTRPTRSINHARIAEIRTGTKHSRVLPASQQTLQSFIESWPYLHEETGVSIFDNELVVKSREAMICAVQLYNNPSACFRAELFIVNSVIAWTYLLHAHYRNIGVDYRYYRNGQVLQTRHGAEKHWQLEDCLASADCPLDDGTKNNLMFLISIRHEIEHQMTSQIDFTISAKLQACALNFDRWICELFGKNFSVQSNLKIAIQFSSFDLRQKTSLLSHGSIPENISSALQQFERDLSDEQYNDPAYSYRAIFIKKVVSSKGMADEVIEFIPVDDERTNQLNSVYLKEVDKPRMRPSKVVEKMNA